MRYAVKIVNHPRVLWGAFLLLVVALVETSVAGQAAPGSTANLNPRKAPEAEAVPQASSRLGTPICPSADRSPALPSQSEPGHHTVTLSWNANVHSPNPDRDAVGYCLYRSRRQNAARQKSQCMECERINLVPVAGTACVDDLVEDGATYYYLISAVNAKGQPSDWSNEAPAQIPNDKQTSSAPAGSPSPPACRGVPETRP